MGLSRRFLNLIVDNRIPGAKSLSCIDLRRHKLFNTTIPVLQLKGNRSESELQQLATPLDDDDKSKMGTSPLPVSSTNLGASGKIPLLASSINLRASGMDSPLRAQSINLRAYTMGYSTDTCVLKPKETESAASPANDRKNYNQAAASIIRKIRTIQLPQPIMNFQCSVDGCHWYLDCLPLAGRKVLCVDASAHPVLFDVVTRQLDTIPCFNFSKCSPLPCWVPHPSSSDATDDGNGSFYILEGLPNQEGQGTRQRPTNQFEAFVYHSLSKSWQRQLLPAPPFATDPKRYEHYRRPKITSYAVVERGGSHVILVSVDAGGTYCLDTVTHTWSHVGDWVLPFTGKAEYVPELKLLFGICTEGWQLGAADLSTMDMDSQPQIVGSWKEIEDAGWWALKPPQLVSLGCGRFCITRFLRALPNPMDFITYDTPVEDFTVLTGVDVVPCVHDVHGTGSDGKVELQMIKHNSRRHKSDGSKIEKVF